MDPQKFYDKAYSWILEQGPRIILALFLLFIGLWFIKLIRRWLKAAMLRRELDPSLQPFLQSLIIVSLQILLILAIMQILGIQMTIFTALVGAMGVAAGLALSGTLQNFASGVLILLLKPFRAGDTILAQGQEGKVSSIQIFYTVITTSDNRTVIIPNSKLSNEVIVNITQQGKRRLDIELKFNYGTNVSVVRNVLEQFIASNQAILVFPEPRTGVSRLEPDGFKLIIHLWIDADKFNDSKLQLQEQLIEHLKTEGIKLPGM